MKCEELTKEHAVIKITRENGRRTNRKPKQTKSNRFSFVLFRVVHKTAMLYKNIGYARRTHPHTVKLQCEKPRGVRIDRIAFQKLIYYLYFILRLENCAKEIGFPPGSKIALRMRPERSSLSILYMRIHSYGNSHQTANCQLHQYLY